MGALQEQKPNTTVSYNPNEAHIVYASDDGFAEILGVSMVSLYENSKDMEFIAVYVLDSGITDTNKKKLESICKTYNRSLPVWIKAMNVSQELSMDVAVDYLSAETFRLIYTGFCIWIATSSLIHLSGSFGILTCREKLSGH